MTSCVNSECTFPIGVNSSAVFLASGAPTEPLVTVRDIFGIMQEAIA